MATTPASVSALLKPQANVGRNAFPLDHRQVYSIKSGQIVPVKALKFVPNDHFEVNVDEFCITFPMQTAPFLRGRKETVFYKVYNSAVWSLFNQYIGQRSDPKTSALNTQLVEPRIKLWDLYRVCLAQFVWYIYAEKGTRAYNMIYHREYTEENLENAIVSSRNNFLNTTMSHDFTNYWKPTSNIGVNFAFEDYPGVDYVLYWFPDYINPNSETVLYRDWCQDIVGHYRVYNYIRKLDMLGYGNILPLFREVEQAIDSLIEVSNWSEGEKATLWNGFVNTVNGYLDALAKRLIKITHTYDNPNSDGEPTPASHFTPVFQNLYAICAYNLIFYHMFRNSFYDLKYNSRDYNLDFISGIYQEGDNDFNIVSITQFSCRFLDIEYHQWKKDQFTGVLPDTQFGAVSQLSFSGISGDDLGKWNNPDSVSAFGTNVGDLFYSGNHRSFVVKDLRALKHTHDISLSFDMIALKRAEILQDYRQTLMRAGNKTSDVFKALFGGAPSSEHEDDIIPQFLETFGEDVFVDPVTSTANTEQGSNGTLGDLSARGKFSGGSKKFSINVGRNYGVVMCLTYFVPTAEYNSYFIDPANSVLNPEDHYITNFENMGLEPIYSDELCALQPRNKIKVLGYAPRYHYLKSQVDVVHGEFVSLPNGARLLNTGSGVFGRGRISTDGFFGAFNIWVAPRTDMQYRNSTQLRDFYINPSTLDNIFVQKADATQMSDHLICNTYLDIKATRGMSKVGLMNFV